ncbi:MAG: hypothetical protein JNG85_07635 [Spirochaetaceae bacterium]|nr:hypothetical protein [Spirochaetaceae bacterium]
MRSARKPPAFLVSVLCVLAAALPAAAQAKALSAPPAVPASAAASPALPGPGAPSESPAILPDDAAPLLGFRLDEAYARLGVPAAVGAHRGAEAWQDDVVFSYKGGYSLFWFGDRLWQLRFVPGYPGSVYGLFLGDSADKVYSLLGTPFYEADSSLVYRLPYRGYPVRLRVVLVEGKVADLYLYRADF